MRVLHVVPSYLPAYRYGGPIYSVHGLCKGLADRGHEVHVFTTNMDGEVDSDVPLCTAVEIDGVRVWYFPAGSPRRLFRSPAMATPLGEAVGQADLVHVHSVFLWPTLAATRAARRLGRPYVLSPRGMLVKDLIARKSRWLKTAWIDLFERRNIAGAAALHATSKIEAREVGRFGFSIRRLVIIPNGVDPLPERDDTVRDPKLVLYIGRVNWKKGLKRLVSAMAYDATARLVIAGNDEEGYSPDLRRFVRGLGLEGRVDLPGPVSGARKRRLLGRAALFVLPSLSENFGNAALEAMAHGCPVILTPEVGAAETVAVSGGGVVSSGAPEVLGPKIRQLLDDPEGLRRMGERGAAYVAENCTWSVVARRMESLYAMLLEGACDEDG